MLAPLDARCTSAVRDFLARYFEDEDRGAVRPLAEYQSNHPDFSDAIADAYARLRSERETQPALTRVGSLRLVCEIGRGGQGRVFLAEDERWTRRVAVKILDGPTTARALKRFRREAQVASRLQHPAICPVFDMGVEDEVPYLVMPFLAGRSLAEILREDGPLSVEQVLERGAALADALQAAHEAGIVHRDLKPSNVLVRPDGAPVLMDFGVAQDVEEEGAGLTETGELLGTLAYMAPEQVSGRRATPRSDVYGLGATLYECLTGAPPFAGPTRHALMEAVLHAPVEDLRRADGRVPTDLRIVLETALAKEPDRRFATAADLAEELRRVREHRPILSRPAGPWLRLRRWMRRSPRLASSVLVSFALLAGGLAITLFLLDRISAERTEKQNALEEIEVLADRTRLTTLRAEIESFEPPRAADLERMDAWLAEADALEERLALHRAILERYRVLALPTTPEQATRDRERHPAFAELQRLQRNRDFVADFHVAELGKTARTEEELGDLAHYRDQLVKIDAKMAGLEEGLDTVRVYRFARPEDRWRHDLEVRLIDELEAFLADAPFEQTRSRVRKLREEAGTIRARSIEARADAWKETVDAIADLDANPAYGGLRIEAQVGLVPLGKDGESGLFEFAHLGSGSPPARDPMTGRLVMTEESGLVFVLLPGGRTTIGAHQPSDEHPLGAAYVDPLVSRFDAPAHEVELAPFFLSKYEMTQGQWLRLTGDNPSNGRAGMQYEGNAPITLAHPVEAVTWFECVDVARRQGLRLPTSAQWEYAVRAGTTSMLFTGDTPGSLLGYANCGDIALARRHGIEPDREYREFGDDGWDGHAPVGSFEPNPFGLHDMVGNVFEWCRDIEHIYNAPWEGPDAERFVGSTANRIARGGSNLNPWINGRSAHRTAFNPDLREFQLGLRLIRELE